jgi:hypothetical protein
LVTIDGGYCSDYIGKQRISSEECVWADIDKNSDIERSHFEDWSDYCA